MFRGNTRKDAFLMLFRARTFLADSAGAVTIDFVALTASAVVIGIVFVYTIMGGESGAVQSVIDAMQGEMRVAAGNMIGTASPPPPPLR